MSVPFNHKKAILCYFECFQPHVLNTFFPRAFLCLPYHMLRMFGDSPLHRWKIYQLQVRRLRSFVIASELYPVDLKALFYLYWFPLIIVSTTRLITWPQLSPLISCQTL